MYDIHTRARNFCKFCTPVVTIPGVRVQHFYTRPELLEVLYARASSVRLSYPYPELLWVLYGIHTRTRNFCELCTPRATIPGEYPGYGYSIFCTRPELMWFLYARATISELLWVLEHFRTRTWHFWKTPIPVPGIHKPYITKSCKTTHGMGCGLVYK